VLNRIAIENAQDIMLWSIENARLVNVNPAACAQLGYSRDELLSMSIPDFDVHYSRELWPAHWSELRKRGTMAFESQYRRRDQSLFFVEIKVSMIVHDGTEYNCAIVRDITDRKDNEDALRESEERFRQLSEAAAVARDKAEQNELEFRKLFENMEQGFALHEVICDENNVPIDYRYKLINKAFGKLTGIDPAKFVGQTVKTLLPNTEPYWIENFGRVAQTGVTLRLENYSQEFDKYYDVVAYSPKPGFFAVVFNDVTVLKKHFAQLEKVNQELDRFVYSTSHDLRAPLASILGLLNLIEMEGMPTQNTNYYALMRKSAERMETFINEILDYSRNSRAATRIERIYFRELIEKLRSNVSAMEGMDTLQITVDLKEDSIFYSDRSRMEIIVNNLLSNAIKYQDPAKQPSYLHIAVTVTFEKAILRFSDNGIGIEAQYVDRIFEMFFRASEHAKGSGLGLYILKEAVTKLGGTVTVDSVFGKGTTFEVVIPSQPMIERP